MGGSYARVFALFDPFGQLVWSLDLADTPLESRAEWKLAKVSEPAAGVLRLMSSTGAVRLFECEYFGAAKSWRVTER